MKKPFSYRKSAPQIPKVPISKAPKPFLKWAGGKGQLLTQLDQFLPVELDENPCFPKKGCFGCRLSHSTYILNDGTHGIPFAVPNKKRSLFIKTSIY